MHERRAPTLAPARRGGPWRGALCLAAALALTTCGEPESQTAAAPHPAADGVLQIQVIDAEGDARGRVGTVPGERIAYLLEHADVIVRGTVGAVTDDTVTFRPAEFLRGDEDDLLIAGAIRNEPPSHSCRSTARFTAGEELVLFLRQNPGDGRLDTVAGRLGKQPLPIDRWMPLSMFAAVAQGKTPAPADIAALVTERGASILARLQSLADVRPALDQEQLLASAGDALDALATAKGHGRAQAEYDLAIALRFLGSAAALDGAALKAARPMVRKRLSGPFTVGRFPILRHLAETDPEWARVALATDLDAAFDELTSDDTNRLPPDLAEGLPLLARLAPEDAIRRIRDVVASVRTRAATFTALEVALDVDREWAGEELVRRSRTESWTKHEHVIAHYAPLLVRVDRAEARMLIRSALPHLADVHRENDAFLAALGRDDAAAARAGLAAAFVQEADRFDNAMRDDRPLYGRQAFFLRCHAACGGTLETYGGWLYRTLYTEPASPLEEAGRVALLHALEEVTGVQLFRFRAPTPAQVESALRAAARVFDEG